MPMSVFAGGRGGYGSNLYFHLDRKRKEKCVNQLCQDAHSLFIHSITKNLDCNYKVVKRQGQQAVQTGPYGLESATTRAHGVTDLAFQTLCHYRMTDGKDFVIIQSDCSPPPQLTQRKIALNDFPTVTQLFYGKDGAGTQISPSLTQCSSQYIHVPQTKAESLPGAQAVCTQGNRINIVHFPGGLILLNDKHFLYLKNAYISEEKYENV